jgi:competence ComEA-like helix-hairpin-helix protein
LRTSLRIISITFYISASLACTTRKDYVPIPHLNTESTVNINTAPAYELEKLPYIGQKTAEAIVKFREQNGTFRRVEHLMLIDGVSEKRFLEIRGLITVE